MRASDWRATLPAGNTEAELENREQMMLAELMSGAFVPLMWTVVPSTWDKWTLHAAVTSDALRVGELGDSVRITLSEKGQQQAADLLGCHLCPAKLDDLAWHWAQLKAPPQTMSATAHDVAIMATTDRMFEHSRRVDEAAGVTPESEGMLVRNVGKIWTVTRAHWLEAGKFRWACNYGWHGPNEPHPAATPDGQKVIQEPGYAHPLFPHWDYSQTAVFSAPSAELINNETDERTTVELDAISCDPVLWRLVQHDGAHPLRHPGVPCPFPPPDGVSPPGCPIKAPFRAPNINPPPGIHPRPSAAQGLSMARRLLPLGVVSATIGALAATGLLRERRSA